MSSGCTGKPCADSRVAIQARVRDVVLVTRRTPRPVRRNRAIASTAPGSARHDTVSTPSMSMRTDLTVAMLAHCRRDPPTDHHPLCKQSGLTRHPPCPHFPAESRATPRIARTVALLRPTEADVADGRAADQLDEAEAAGG